MSATFIPHKIPEIKISSWREYNFYIERLKGSIPTLKYKGINQIIDACEQKRNDNDTQKCSLFEYTKNMNGTIAKSGVPGLDNLVKRTQTAFEETQLSDDNFKWIDKKDERLCNWVWCYIKNSPYILEASSPIQRLNHKILKTNKRSSERYKGIIKSFLQAELHRDEQFTAIESIHQEWVNYVYPYDEFIKWFKANNSTQVDWVLKYIKNYQSYEIDIAWQPATQTDQKNAIITTMDLWDNNAEKELFLNKIKKAWSQKKFRDKPNGKKPYSFSMTEKTKQRLDELAELKELNLNEVIEQLIRKEHELNDL